MGQPNRGSRLPSGARADPCLLHLLHPLPCLPHPFPYPMYLPAFPRTARELLPLLPPPLPILEAPPLVLRPLLLVQGPRLSYWNRYSPHQERSDTYYLH